MNIDLFRKWFESAKPNQKLMRPLVEALKTADASKVDRIFAQAVADPNDPWSLEEVVGTLKASGVDVSAVLSTQAKVAPVSVPAAPVAAPVAASATPEPVVVAAPQPTPAPVAAEPDPVPAEVTVPVAVSAPEPVVSKPTPVADPKPAPKVVAPQPAPAAPKKAQKPAFKMPSMPKLPAFSLDGASKFLDKFMPKMKKGAAPDASKSAPAGNPMAKIMENKKLLIAGGVALLLLVLVGVVMASGAFASDPYGDSGFSDIPSGETPSFIAPNTADTQTEEVAPQLTNPTPLDFVSTPWLKALQGLILAEFFGVLAAVFGDGKFREQLGDAFVAIVCALVTVFVAAPDGTSVWFVGLFLFVVSGVVVYVSLSGGRDFSPIAAYLLVIGILGGMIFNKIGLLQSTFPVIQSAPVLPMVQIGVLFQLKDYGAMWFPLLIYAIILAGVIASIFEGLRPSEDKTSRVWTIISAVLGIFTYFLFLYALHIPAWISYVIAFLGAVGFAALSQNERVVRVVTMKWSIRSPFDGAMIVTAVLLMLQIITGTVGLIW